MIADALKEAEQKMKGSIEHTREEFATIRTGRASPAVLQKITVDYYGTQTPLVQLAQINVPDPRSLAITPYDKGAMGAIEKAIQSSDLGITPNNDGQNIRIAFPPLTEERRKELIKVVRDRAEQGRVAIRAVRRHAKDSLDKALKDGHVSEDDIRRSEKELQALTDRFIAEVDEMLKRKEAELLEV
ncbi:MAG: ribosome recycling factor [Actinomycetota bacterium]